MARKYSNYSQYQETILVYPSPVTSSPKLSILLSQSPESSTRASLARKSSIWNRSSYLLSNSWQSDYTYDFIAAGNPFRSNLQPNYEQCTFHKRTGWDN